MLSAYISIIKVFYFYINLKIKEPIFFLFSSQPVSLLPILELINIDFNKNHIFNKLNYFRS